MKRGLKVKVTSASMGWLSGVTTVTPMKRGLKVRCRRRRRESYPSYNRYPDEKGTESEDKILQYAPEDGYNRYPDEKGTESLRRAHAVRVYLVTTVTPMKRGLKESYLEAERDSYLQLQPLPR